MGCKTCPDCSGAGWSYTPSDAKITCSTCGGSGAVPSDEPGDEWNEVVIDSYGRPRVQRIDITK